MDTCQQHTILLELSMAKVSCRQYFNPWPGFLPYSLILNQPSFDQVFAIDVNGEIER